MHIDLWTLGLQAINVLVLVWLLARFLFRPLTAIIAQRRQATETLLADATAARAQAQAASRLDRAATPGAGCGGRPAARDGAPGRRSRSRRAAHAGARGNCRGTQGS